jgi:hypothetical protein
MPPDASGGTVPLMLRVCLGCIPVGGRNSNSNTNNQTRAVIVNYNGNLNNNNKNNNNYVRCAWRILILLRGVGRFFLNVNDKV